MRALLALAIALSLSCGPPPVVRNFNCCTPTPIQRNFGFGGSYALDGGSTQVQLIVGSDGRTTITFMRGSDVVVETFQASSP